MSAAPCARGSNLSWTIWENRAGNKAWQGRYGLRVRTIKQIVSLRASRCRRQSGLGEETTFLIWRFSRLRKVRQREEAARVGRRSRICRALARPRRPFRLRNCRGCDVSGSTTRVHIAQGKSESSSAVRSRDRVLFDQPARRSLRGGISEVLYRTRIRRSIATCIHKRELG